MRLIALASLLTLLAACDAGDSYVVRSRVNGQWQVDARAHVEAGIATFACVHSASGRCHFSLFDKGCGSLAGGTQCDAKLLKQFSVAVDASKTLQGISGFRLCASHVPEPMAPDCGAIAHTAPIAGL